MVVLFDCECGFCAWTLAWLIRWDRGARLRPVAIQSSEGERLLAGMPADVRLGSWHAARDDGVVFSGGAALSEVLHELPGGTALARVTERVPRLTERAYRAVAARRNWLGPRLPRRGVARAQRLVAKRTGSFHPP